MVVVGPKRAAAGETQDGGRDRVLVVSQGLPDDGHVVKLSRRSCAMTIAPNGITRMDDASVLCQSGFGTWLCRHHVTQLALHLLQTLSG